MSDPIPLSRNRDFNVFWLGQTLSGLGDAFAAVAIPLLVLQATGSLTAMGTLTAVVVGSYLASGLVSGAVVDRVDRRRLMVVCDLARFALYAAVPLWWWLRGPSYPVLVAASAAGALLGNTFQVTSITAVARLVPREQLLDANGRMQGAYTVMFAVGPMLAAWVCRRWGPVAAVGIDAVSFLVSALSLMLVRAPFSVEKPTTSAAPLRDFVEGLRFLWEHRVLRATVLLLGASTLLVSGRENLLVYHVTRDLHRDENAVGALFAVASVGGVVGALLAPPMRARWGFAASWLGAGVALALATLALGRAHSIVALGALAAVVVGAETVRGINTVTLRQEVTPDHLLGRVTAAFWSTLNVPGALGAWGSARVAEAVGVPRMLTLSGVGVLVLMALGAVSPLRTAARRANPSRDTAST